MRAGGCTVQHALTPEAATIVKQAVTLARRRGHAQVTPLHVANAMFSSSACLFRSACLQSHSHPLQCKALELCFNVALNRLPASTSSSPMLGHHHHLLLHHHHPPALSNALVAAFKRAQAHQRRGSVDTQPQPLLAVKIEVEQMVISILDDPSVSRVMREAGFSSTQVKTNVEKTISLEMSSSTVPSPSKSNPNNNRPNKAKPLLEHQPRISSDQDVMSVVECLVSTRKKSVVVVGECLSTSDSIVKGVMDKIERGQVPEVLKSVQCINLPLFSFSHLSKEEVEKKVGELRCLVKSCCVGRGGALLYLGDLKWAADGYMATSFGGEKKGGDDYYCPVEHVTMELGRLACGGIHGEEKFWLMGFATYQTYMRCRDGHPSLESLWGLHPLTVPAGSLVLSLEFDSELLKPMRSKRNGDGSPWSLLEDGVDQNQLNCCVDCTAKFDIEVRALSNNSSSGLPSWLQQYKEENRRTTTNDLDGLQLRELCRKWNSICKSNHKQRLHFPEKTLNFSSVVSPCLSSISSSCEQHCCSFNNQTRQSWPIPISARYPWSDHHHFGVSADATDENPDPHPRLFYLQEPMEPRQALLSPPNPNPTSTSSGETMEMEYDHQYHHRFKEINAENLKILCSKLEKKVPWQVDVIPEIASTILQCRSGMMRRKCRQRPSSNSARTREDTWLFFQGCDPEGKERVARELASIIFGSYTKFISIRSSNFSPTKSDSTDGSNNKRWRSEESSSYLERFAAAIQDETHRVFLMEDIEHVDYRSQNGIKAAIETGRIRCSEGEEVDLEDAIVILSCESFDSRSRACSPPVRQKHGAECEEGSSCVSLDLNISAGDLGDDGVDDEDHHDLEEDDVGLLDSVDRRFFFKLMDDF